MDSIRWLTKKERKEILNIEITKLQTRNEDYINKEHELLEQLKEIEKNKVAVQKNLRHMHQELDKLKGKIEEVKPFKNQLSL